jgi:hypothetical protein
MTTALPFLAAPINVGSANPEFKLKPGPAKLNRRGLLPRIMPLEFTSLTISSRVNFICP